MRHRPAFLILAGVIALVSAGCYRHNMPPMGSFNGSPRTSTFQIFVDANGTPYPADWDRYMERPKYRWAASSLLNQSANDYEFRTHILEQEQAQLEAFERFATGRRRIFILVHGFNNDAAEAGIAYDLIESKIDLRPSDGVVRFFWDGLVANETLQVGAAKIWFNATGYSQVAGSRALRPPLDRIGDTTDVILIGHSRGASVILSALGNPIYAPAFRKQTLAVAAGWGGGFENFLNPDKSRRRAGLTQVLVMAPAVGRIDFCDENEQDAADHARGPFECERLRDFDVPLTAFRYTVNEKDKVLLKYLGAGNHFNPTNLGTHASVGEGLATEKYGRVGQPLVNGRTGLFKAYEFATDRTSHAWVDYINDATFTKMLQDAGIALREPAR